MFPAVARSGSDQVPNRPVTEWCCDGMTVENRPRHGNAMTLTDCHPAAVTDGRQCTEAAARMPQGMCKVPEVTAFFWIVTALTTAFGESASDFRVHALPPIGAVLLGFVAFCAAPAVQLRTSRYRAWPYWTAATMVGVFGTMAADVLHVALHGPPCRQWCSASCSQPCSLRGTGRRECCRFIPSTRPGGNSSTGRRSSPSRSRRLTSTRYATRMLTTSAASSPARRTIKYLANTDYLSLL